MSIRELHSLRVFIDKIVYSPNLDAPEERPYPFVYFITIENASDETVTIRGRKWVVTESDGARVVIEGEGLVGRFPSLEPGETFSYNSYHVVGSNSVAEGAFLGISDEGVPFVTRIPRFELIIPN